MNREPGLFVNWLRSHHRLGQFQRRDQWGQLSLSRLDEIVISKMHILDLEEKIRDRDARYEEQAFLAAAFSANPAAKDIFLNMFPDYENEDEELGFIIPASAEETESLLAYARENGLFPDTK